MTGLFAGYMIIGDYAKGETGATGTFILAYRPWTLAVEPFQVAPHTWYVAGQTWVGCYLIDTGAGLILIDTAIPESLYLLVDSIYKIGFNPRDIKRILISHAHFDHMGAAGAMKELTGAELYMSKEDTKFMEECPEETLVLDKDSHPQTFGGLWGKD